MFFDMVKFCCDFNYKVSGKLLSRGLGFSFKQQCGDCLSSVEIFLECCGYL